MIQEKDIHPINGCGNKVLFISKDKTEKENTAILQQTLATVFNGHIITFDENWYGLRNYKTLISKVKGLCNINENTINEFTEIILECIGSPVINTSDNQE